MSCRVYDEYSFQVIPVMGHLIAGDWHSYQYLVESIRKFPNQVNRCAIDDLSFIALIKYLYVILPRSYVYSSLFGLALSYFRKLCRGTDKCAYR